jgi:3-oxoacyl-[acyl-carrier protein] reductase
MLKDKTVLVTGASRGVGKETARACAAAGAKVILHFNVNQDEAVALAKEIDAVGCIAADLSQKGAADRIWLKAKTMAGGVDALVNNAGVYRETPLHNAQSWEAGWTEQLQVNVIAPCELMRNAINEWGARPAGPSSVSPAGPPIAAMGRTMPVMRHPRARWSLQQKPSPARMRTTMS